MNIVFGITGNLGTGKSSLALDLQSYWATQNKSLKIIELDNVRRYALWESTSKHHIQLRKDLARALKLPVEKDFCWLNRKELTKLIFSSREKLDTFAQIVTPFFMYDIEKDILSEDIDVVIVWAHLLEENYQQLLNSSVILTNCSSDTVINRLMPSTFKIGELSYKELQKRIDLQPSIQERLTTANEKNINCFILENEKHIEKSGLKNLFDLVHHNHKEKFEENSLYESNLNFCRFKIPLNGGRVMWEVTNECNYGCKYCIFASTGRKPEGELSTEEMFSALRQLKDKGFSHIKFTGGEPFLRDDMLDILKEADSLGFHYDISTNASKINDYLASELSKLNLEFIHVSLDGYDLNSHESVRGKKSFLPTIKGLKILSQQRLKMRIGCVIHSENENNIGDIVSFYSSLGIRHIVFSMMEPIGRLRNKTKGLATKSIKELIEIIEETRKYYPHILILHNLQSMQKISLDSIRNKSVNTESNSCPAGERFLFINSLGDVSPCTLVSEHRHQYIGGKINQMSLDTILNSNPIKEMRNLANELAFNKKVICPMTDLATTEKLELSIKASDIKNHEIKFGKFAPIYRFTTENIKYIPMLEVDNKTVLTVGGSYDHAIDLSLFNASKIENIDINFCAKYYAQLKIEALLSLSYNSFKEFLGNSKKTLDFDIYKSIVKNLPLECANFFNNLYKKFNNNGKQLSQSLYFHNRDNQEFLLNSYYLLNENQFLIAKEKVKENRFIWHNQSILNTENINNFDIILLSNIADYSHKMFNVENHAEKFKNEVVLPWLSHLNSNGKIMFAYVFDSQNILKSDKRNNFNEPNLRKSLYSNIEGYKYYEIQLDSSIKDALTDCICVLEKNN